MTLDERVKRVIRKALILGDAEITPEMRLAEDLGITSLDRFDLVIWIEEEFGIELSDEDQETIKTVGDLIHRVEHYQLA